MSRSLGNFIPSMSEAKHTPRRPGAGVPVAPVAGNNVHTDFSCGRGIDHLCETKIQRIIGSQEATRSIYGIIKRCLHSRYTDNLAPPVPPGAIKIRNIHELRIELRPMFNHLRDIIITNNNFNINIIALNHRRAIESAIDHFSVICGLTKLAIIINYFKENHYRITDIKYIQNSSLLDGSPATERRRYSDLQALSINTFGDYQNNFYMNIDWNSAFTDNTLTPGHAQLRNDDKAKIQIIRLFSSIMRIFHSHNFEITATRGRDNKIYSTQNDLFKSGYTNNHDINIPDSYSFDKFIYEKNIGTKHNSYLNNDKKPVNFVNINNIKRTHNQQYTPGLTAALQANPNLFNVNYKETFLINVNDLDRLPIYLNIFDEANPDDINNKITLFTTLNDLIINDTHKFTKRDRTTIDINIANINNTLFIRLLKDFNPTYEPKRLSSERRLITTIPACMYMLPDTYHNFMIWRAQQNIILAQEREAEAIRIAQEREAEEIRIAEERLRIAQEEEAEMARIQNQLRRARNERLRLEEQRRVNNSRTYDIKQPKGIAKIKTFIKKSGGELRELAKKISNELALGRTTYTSAEIKAHIKTRHPYNFKNNN